jgi:DNA polymerase IIIc chi subunit
LTTADENPNEAQVLFLTDGTSSENVADYQLCAELFDGNDEAAVQTELHPVLQQHAQQESELQGMVAPPMPPDASGAPPGPGNGQMVQ